MPRRVLGLLFAAALTLGLCGCTDSDYPYYDMEIEWGGGTSCYEFPLNTVEDLAEHSSLIVRGEVQGDSKEVTFQNVVTYTVSTLKVTKVIQGDARAGDALTLYEEYSVKKENGKDILHLDANYMPSKVGKEYLFFLGERSGMDDAYGPVMTDAGGRFPVIDSRAKVSPDVDSISIQELYLAKDSPHYRELYKEVIQTYMQ